VAEDWVTLIEMQLAPGACVERKGANVTLFVKEMTKDAVFLKAKEEGGKMIGPVRYRGYVSPTHNSPFLTEERGFNLMFRTSLGAVDQAETLADLILERKASNKEELKKLIQGHLDHSAAFLRPETAQSTYVQFANYLQTTGTHLPFGIAQIGKSFRNEITLEHMIFRTPEFEQMELQFFCRPGEDEQWHKYWQEERLRWWQKLANHPEKFMLKHHEQKDLAHYAKACTDIEYEFPWGMGEVEGIANRSDFDLKRHSAASGTKLEFFDTADASNPAAETTHITPYVIEPAAGLNRGFFALLFDAYHEEEKIGANGQPARRVVMKFHPKIAPIKLAILPIVKQQGMVDFAKKATEAFVQEGIKVKYEDNKSIGKRYSRHDEIGTPYCLTVDDETMKDGSVTIRDRDSTQQQRLTLNEALSFVKSKVFLNLKQNNFFFFF